MTSRDTHDIEQYELEEKLAVIYERMLDIARWHAQLQVSFDRVLQRELAEK
ncbi:MAG: hypothetical protein ACO3CH_00230 [Ilumatobacteraceae bacterium]